MKTPSFWYQPKGARAALLNPLGLLWCAGGAVRRVFARPYRGRKPVICIGNVVTGGAGKTPTAMAIARILLKAGHKPVFVTRGYGGEEIGPLRVDPESHAARDVGDEALLLACLAPVFIGQDRAAALREAEMHGSHIVMDDGLQNPHVAPHISFLVIDAGTGLGNGCIMPAGPLREPLSEAMQRVSAVIIIGEGDQSSYAAQITKPKLSAKIIPRLGGDFPRDKKFLVFAGIGHPQKFYESCREAGLKIIGSEDFPDHFLFDEDDLVRLHKKAESLGAQLLTTEKDYVRIPHDFRTKVMALPVELQFDDLASIEKLLTLE